VVSGNSVGPGLDEITLGNAKTKVWETGEKKKTRGGLGTGKKKEKKELEKKRGG